MGLGRGGDPGVTAAGPARLLSPPGVSHTGEKATGTAGRAARGGGGGSKRYGRGNWSQSGTEGDRSPPSQHRFRH